MNRVLPCLAGLLIPLGVSAVSQANEWTEKDFKKECGGQTTATENTVCFDLTQTPARLVAPPQNTIWPNRSIRVFVLRPKASSATINAEATPAIAGMAVNGLVDDAPGPAAPPVVEGAGTSSENPDHIVQYRSLAPRPSGPVPVTVKHRPGGCQDEKKEKTIPCDEVSYSMELIAAKVFMGAVRTGIGVLFGSGVVDREYTAQRAPGSAPTSPYEITAGSNASTAFELTAGYAFYPETFWGGRCYERLCGFKNKRHLYFAPYVGVGLLGTQASANSVGFFKTFYLGGEIELAPNVSVAVTWALRRVSRLPTGYELGSAIDTTTVPTSITHASGGAVLINLSTDFMKLVPGFKP